MNQELVPEVSSILMEDEKYALHNWQSKDIYPKSKDSDIAQLVSETILSFRCNLIKDRIALLQKEIEDPNHHHSEVLEEIVNYLQLKKLLSKKLNRVLS